MPSKLSSLLQGFLRGQKHWITLIIFLKHSQTRYTTNADKTEATGNTYIHTKTNRNTNRHTDRNPCKHGNVKIIKYNKIYIKKSVLIRFDCLFTINKIYKAHSDIKNING